MLKNEYEIHYFDNIIVCTGHSFLPHYPNIENMDKFQGRKLHSHFYRNGSIFKGIFEINKKKLLNTYYETIPNLDQKLLIVGSWSNSLQIAALNNDVAKHIYLAHPLHHKLQLNNLQNITAKPAVREFFENGAIFEDGTRECFDMLLLCTGYDTDLPCLSTDCQLRIWRNHVYPLYKQCINVHHPSMALIGELYCTTIILLMKEIIGFCF